MGNTASRETPVPPQDGEESTHQNEEDNIVDVVATSIENSMESPPLDICTPAETPPPATRDRSTTEATLRDLLTAYQLSPPLEVSRFVGLCPYLCALLRWGWHASTADMDAFSILYPTFTAHLHAFETAQMERDLIAIPSYHQWFLEQPRDAYQQNILREQNLREIWRENRYESRRAQLCLTAIMNGNAPWSTAPWDPSPSSRVDDDGGAAEDETPPPDAQRSVQQSGSRKRKRPESK
ncbi:hypothetical protein CLCR_07569 [Cladophialophora carrionii]|uniref:Uncharacterized protein n=1 Tax=Cladophialophora carrionii TaxID=86049 RepID=A0A1C1CM75_9EURO|nr:hypothetical protein CLCR_07569 [Cladophialophora carrionii]